MAKKSMVERQRKREKLVARYAARRTELQKVLRDPMRMMRQRMLHE